MTRHRIGSRKSKVSSRKSEIAGELLKLIVKVDPTRAKDPAQHVSQVLREADSKGSRVEEVFPGLKDGESAGLVSVELDDAHDAETHRAAVRALKNDAAISYVNTPKTRRPL